MVTVMVRTPKHAKASMNRAPAGARRAHPCHVARIKTPQCPSTLPRRVVVQLGDAMIKTLARILGQFVIAASLIGAAQAQVETVVVTGSRMNSESDAPHVG